MSEKCEQTRQELVRRAWSIDDLKAAEQMLGHLTECEQCRAAAEEYAAIRTAIGPADAEAVPRDGWEAFDQRLANTAQSRSRSWWRNAWIGRVAAGLLVTLTLLNVLLMLRTIGRRGDADTAKASTIQAPELSDALVAKAFATVAHEFEGRATWVMLSAQDNDIGLAQQKVPAAELLILCLQLTRGDAAVSQIQLAIVPGETARVRVPSSSGEQVQYVITTDARDLQHIGVWMAVAAQKDKPDGTDLGTMAMSVKLGYGASTHAGQILTREGTYNLSMSLQHRHADSTGV